ncbi:DUF192 domain-containing protein [Halorubrum sp. Boch-26]|uniref:DUF192 domain-containing protein n=1 Tax=Halorubrum sp. Boch-26 TaxID=2994426 RepID=UPI0024697AAE|nr:DUF192 domain-containing protein [Halorubrum sp. Boch-26]
MRRRELVAAIGAGSVGALAGCVGAGPPASEGQEEAAGDDTPPGEEWPSGAYADYETTVVEVRTSDGDPLGRVTAAIADTGEKRYTGLSDAGSLPEDAGMLFVFPAEREGLTFVMREMEFGIDIVYADPDGTVVEIHNAPKPGPNEDGNDQAYPGSGQYVLELPYKWTDRNGVAVGDALAFEL